MKMEYVTAQELRSFRRWQTTLQEWFTRKLEEAGGSTHRDRQLERRVLEEFHRDKPTGVHFRRDRFESHHVVGPLRVTFRVSFEVDGRFFWIVPRVHMIAVDPRDRLRVQEEPTLPDSIFSPEEGVWEVDEAWTESPAFRVAAQLFGVFYNEPDPTYQVSNNNGPVYVHLGPYTTHRSKNGLIHFRNVKAPRNARNVPPPPANRVDPISLRRVGRNAYYFAPNVLPNGRIAQVYEHATIQKLLPSGRSPMSRRRISQANVRQIDLKAWNLRRRGKVAAASLAVPNLLTRAAIRRAKANRLARKRKA